jgi:hypothetical protein
MVAPAPRGSLTHHFSGCPTLATFLFLWLGWDRTDPSIRAVILSGDREAIGVEGSAVAFRAFNPRRERCPTLAVFLFLRLGWDRTNPSIRAVILSGDREAIGVEGSAVAFRAFNPTRERVPHPHRVLVFAAVLGIAQCDVNTPENRPRRGQGCEPRTNSRQRMQSWVSRKMRSAAP